MAEIIRRNAVDTSKINFQGRTWAGIKEMCQAKIETLRNQNDNLHCSPEKTIEIRARIAVYKEILELEKK